jgi:hypothetical protein
LFESTHALILDFDEMEPKARAHGRAHLPDIQSKRCILELLHHDALAKPSQIAAVPSVARVFRVLFRKLGKVCSRI